MIVVDILICKIALNGHKSAENFCNNSLLNISNKS